MEIEVIKSKRDEKVLIYYPVTSDFVAELVASIELVCEMRGVGVSVSRRESIVVREDRG